MALADLNIVPATSATSFEYKHNCIKFRETNMHSFFYFFAVTKPQKFERQSLSMQWAAFSKPHLLTYFARYSCCRNQIRGTYKEHSFNVVTGALQGVLLIPFTFPLLQPFEVFSLDRTTLLLHSYPSTLKTGSRSRKTFPLLDSSNNTSTQLYSKSTQWFLRYLCMWKLNILLYFFRYKIKVFLFKNNLN